MVALLGGLLVLFVTFWVVYGVLFVAVNRWVPISHETRLLISAAYLVLLFLGYARSDSEYLSQLRVETVDGRPAYSIHLPGGWHVSNVNWLNPTNVQSLAKVISQLLFTGPRALGSAWRNAVKARALLQANAANCTPVFPILLARGKRAPYAELAAFAGTEPPKVFGDLLLIDVAQHLQSPPGLVVSSAVREQITGIKPLGAVEW